MKRLKLIIPGLVVSVASLFYISCSKETPGIASIENDFNNSARVQVFSATLKATANYVYVDNTPVSGAAVAYGGVFPGTANSFKVDAGSRALSIKDTLPGTTQVPLSFTQDFEGGKSYTIFTYDTITNIKQVTILNNVIVPTDTTSMLRFGNFLYSTSPLSNVDVYSFRRGTSSPIFSNVATAAVTGFIPYAAGLTDTLYVYATGTTSPLIAKASVPSLIQTKSYTSVLTGSLTGTKTAIPIFATY